MEPIVHNLSNLFRQLGMAGDASNIDAFISSHRLEAGTRLPQAPFWTPSQAQFLMRAICDDANWAIAADELAARLS
jgi:Protein of unknown function (DUF2789)